MIRSFWRYRRRIVSSVTGWLRRAYANPRDSIELLRARIKYAMTGDMGSVWSDHNGFEVDTPQKLVSYWNIFVERELDHPAWISAVRNHGQPLVIDVGANAGVFAHRVFCLNRAASLLAVEPQPYLTEKVLIPYARKQNVKMQVVQAACSDRDGSAELCFNQVGEGTASLQGRDGVCSQSVRVPLVTLDRIAPSGEIQLLKIDTEGHDVMVLAGAKSVLERVSFLIVELRSANEVAMAAALLGPCWDRVRLSASDSLFVRRK